LVSIVEVSLFSRFLVYIKKSKNKLYSFRKYKNLFIRKCIKFSNISIQWLWLPSVIF
jgi:hypothetical protein